MSRPPKADAASATSLVTSSATPVSARKPMTVAPVAPAISEAAACAASSSRAHSATLTPSAASSRATAYPMPRVPPVTSAFLPAMPKSIGSLRLIALCACPTRSVSPSYDMTVLSYENRTGHHAGRFCYCSPIALPRPYAANVVPNTTATIDMSLMRMLSDGPDVSLKGSPTVSPTTAAACSFEPLPP